MKRYAITTRQSTPTTRQSTTKKRFIARNALSKSEMRAQVSSPTRKDLTKSQYFEWACALRALRQYGFSNAETLSLDEMRSVLHSMKYCDSLRAVYNYNHC